VETEGDRREPDTAWGEGAFVTAIEQALLEGRVDLAVHSAKDVPTDEDPRLRIVAYLPRADARDALVARDPSVAALDDLPRGARVGTDSPRRTGFLLARRPDLDVHPLHGNVDTRLARLERGETDALVLAAAGLDRLERGHRATLRFGVDVMPPAPGQGALAVQGRADDGDVGRVGREIDEPSVRAAVQAERAFLVAAGGGCRAPIGAYAEVGDDGLSLLAGLVEPSGANAVVGRHQGSPDEGPALAAALLGWLRSDRSRPVVSA
jgi:hydroxymethylbilane synthase